jgi:formiminotetrahydrofolate cyclodeaminase
MMSSIALKHILDIRAMPNMSLADLRIGAFVELVSSDHIAPGAGAAAAVTLALAAACGAKAVAVSLRHAPDDTCLSMAHTRLKKLCDSALQGADTDAQAFTNFVRHRSDNSARELAETGEAIDHLIDALSLIIEEVESHIRSNMAGDLIAAKALATAVRTIQAADEAESRGAQRTIEERPR